MELRKEPIKKRSKVRKIVIYSLISLAILITAVFSFAYMYAKRSLPVTKGEIFVPSLKDEVKVYRDKMGVPHINATNDYDLYFSQGFVTAQDRLFQMDLSRRQSSGQLSEVVGKVALDRDKYFLTLGLRRAAEESWNQYTEEYRNIIQAYTDGVNAYRMGAIKSKRLQIEFKLLGYEPTEWTPVDSLAIGKYMAFDLGGNWEGQAFRHWSLQELSKNKALELFPTYPKDAATIIAENIANPIDIESSFASTIQRNEWNGSNNWVVSGAKTKSGKPMLADDPHLSLATPSVWYETHLVSPTMNVQGVIFAGIPGIILGHNDDIAWGVTNVGPDVQDLYIEKPNPENELEFKYEGAYEAAKVVKYNIKVKDEKEIPYDVVITRHGPIVSEFMGDYNKKQKLALKWTALQPSNELEAVIKMNKSSNWDEFLKALESFHTPAQNFVFASTDGTIGYRANGLIPIRKNGDSLLPVPGWVDDYEWQGYIPWDELPTILNPKEGYIATANNKVVDDEYPYHISNTWAQPYRAERIKEVLKSDSEITVNDFMKLQTDYANLRAREFLPLLLPIIKVKTEEEKEALKLLSEWNKVDDATLAAPLVFQFLFDKLQHNLFDKDIPESMQSKFLGKDLVIDEMIRKASMGNESIWIKDAGGYEKWINKSFEDAISRGTEMYGDDITDWKWGDFHQVEFSHPLSSTAPLQYLFNQSDNLPVGGSKVTVGAAGYKADTGIVNHGASWRFIIDMVNTSESYHTVGPGQSGHFLSEWYHNQKADWATGTYHMTNSDDSYKENSDLLLLKP